MRLFRPLVLSDLYFDVRMSSKARGPRVYEYFIKFSLVASLPPPPPLPSFRPRGETSLRTNSFYFKDFFLLFDSAFLRQCVFSFVLYNSKKKIRVYL